jgi:uncharacterized membrane protein YkvA (DUF1232 family)
MKESGIENKIDLVKSGFNQALEKSNSYLNEPDRLSIIAHEAFEKGLRVRLNMYDAWDYLQHFYNVTENYVNGNSLSVSKKHMRYIVAALIYFVTPTDVLPDFVPMFGLIDDLFVISLVASTIQKIPATT